MALSRKIQKIYPLSPMQSGMLFHSLMNEKSGAYFEQKTLQIEGKINGELLEKSFNILIDRYDIFRTIFRVEKLKEPLQFVLKQRKLTLHVEDISHLNESEKETALDEFKERDKKKGFDLTRDLLIRLSLIKTDKDKFILIWSSHHILMDGWCLGIVYNDLIQIYRALKEGKPVELEPITPYMNYINWLQRQNKKAGFNYWQKYLDGYEDSAVLSQTNLMVKDGHYRVQEHTTFIDEEQTERLHKIARKHQITINTLFQTLWGILLQRYSNKNDVVFGVVVSGRPPEIKGIESMVGLFINTIPLRIRSHDGQSVSQLLKTVQMQAASSKKYEYLPLVDIQSNLISKRDLIDHIMAFENVPIQEQLKNTDIEQKTDFQVKSVELLSQSSYNLNIVIHPMKCFQVKFNYNALVYEGDFIKRLGLHFKRYIQQVTENPDIAVQDIKILTEEEKRQILLDFNSSRVDFPTDKTIHQLFEQQVIRGGDHMALLGQGLDHSEKEDLGEQLFQVTYKELNNRADALAGTLKNIVMKPDTIVAVMLERSIELITVLLSIFKASGAYLSIDPGYPPERIDYMLADSGAEVMITAGSLSEKAETLKLAKNRTIFLDTPLKAASLPGLASSDSMGSDNLAYVIYTSGSTGKPKGVLIRHRGFVNLIYYHQKIFGETSFDRMSQVASPGFDAMAFEVWPCLACGAGLDIAENEIRSDVSKLKQWLIRHGITISFQPTVMAEYLLGEEWPKTGVGLRVLRTAGDKLTRYPAHPYPFTMYNLYGPTEDTVWSTWTEVEVKPDYVMPPSIGKPVGNHRVFIMDQNSDLQPVGVPGELCISGEGLAVGYLNRPELTKEKFLQPSPVSEDKVADLDRHVMYRTGDQAYWLKDGNIQFLGRMDQQVKIRGFRIELGEIENRLLKYEGIKEAVVMANSQNGGDKYICAYFVPTLGHSNHSVEDLELRKHLAKTLPDFMIPNFFIQLEKIPLTPNGKVDRKVLPLPDTLTVDNYVPPRSEMEEKLVDIWSEVLDIARETIGIDSNFFKLGGHSLKATILTSLIHKEMDIKLPIAEVLQRQTIRALSDYIRLAATTRYAGINAVEKREFYALSSAQKRLYFLQQMDVNSTSYNIPLVLPLGKNLNRDGLNSGLTKLIARHESLRTTFEKVNGVPVQRIHENVDFSVENIEMTEKPESRDRYDQAFIQQFIRPFDLGSAPIVRSALVKLHEGHYLWIIDIHHIVSDGTSHMILWEDFLALYRGNKLNPLRLHYKDFSEWQNDLISSGKIKNQEDYWFNLYSGEIPRLQLPTDYKRPEVFTFVGETYEFVLDRTDAEGFRELGSRNGATLYMSILAVLNVLFYKYTNQTDIIIGTGIAGRPHADLQKIIGMFVNTLAMRNYPRGDIDYESFLKEVAADSARAFENQDLQFEELVDKLELERDASRNPLFDILMVVQNFRRVGEGRASKETQGQMEVLPLTDPGLPALRYQNPTSKFDMTFFVTDSQDDVPINIEYYSGIFKRDTIERFSEHFKKIVKEVVHNPYLRLKDLEIISDAEKQQLVYSFNNTRTSYPRDRAIGDLFEEQAESIPNQVAVVMGEESITYQTLNQQADQLANYLYCENGLAADQPVAILMDRNILLIVVVVGIIKAGGAYVPINPAFPEERIKTLIDDSGSRILIGQRYYIKILNRLQWECRELARFLCIDSENVNGEEEVEENELMDRKLWEYVGETSVDEVTGGGWNSSYTGNPIPGKEMDEYGDNILKKLEPLLTNDMRILEIGCASGISMYRLAPRVGLYYGTDMSAAILEKNRLRIKEEGHGNIKLCRLAAHEIDQLEEGNFDLVILNSVIQCFNGHNYLRKVLKKIIHLMGDTGYIFIGDIMDQDLKENLIADLLAFSQSNKDRNYKTKLDWSQELFISRAFVEDLAWDYPEICDVEFSDKIFTIENELTKFRYDALLSISKTVKNNRTKARQREQHDLSTLSKYNSMKLPVNLSSDNLAYIIYTSGSTGIPKGVMVTHRNVVRLVKNTNYVKFDQKNRILQTGALEFDASTFEIWGALLNGMELHLAAKDILLTPEKLKKNIQDGDIKTMWMTAPLFNQMMDTDIEIFKNLENLLVGGDILSPPHINRIKRKFPQLNVINGYGPTENTTFSTTFLIDKEFEQNIPIGKPIANSTAYIVDKDNHVVAMGVKGELLVGGDGVARGYLNSPELTADKFVGLTIYLPQQPASTSQILYRTGDLARWMPDGAIEFFGRIDQQVKIRGFRIELEEIEARLLKHETVKDTVVIDRKPESGGEKFLCAYVVLAERLDGKWDTTQLREYLSRKLPEFMVPSYFVPLKKIPLTTNGKVDRRALPKPEFELATEDYAVPRNKTEERLAETWQEVLGVKRVGINENFFEIGGDSIKAIQVSARLKRYGLTFKISDFFLFPTIGELAKSIMEAERSSHQGTVEGNVELTPIQYWFFQSDFTHKNHFNQSVMLYKEEGFVEDKLQLLFTKITEHHDSLRMVFKLDENRVIQVNRGKTEKLYDFEVFDFTNFEAFKERIQEETDRIQRGIDIQEGPLMRIGLFKTGKGDHLLIVIHHLVIDGISWRILLEDFADGYRQLDQGREIEFPAKSDSFQSWARTLKEYAGGSEEEDVAEVLREFEYWKSIDDTSLERLPVDREIGTEQQKIKYDEVALMVLDRRDTDRLLKKVNWAYNTEINDILLAALGLSIVEWAGLEKVCINLEGHGRESIVEGIDISRTVGWFTSQYPVILNMSQTQDLSYIIKSVKETLRRIPNKGIGYGILKYLTPDKKKEGLRFMLRPEIGFNYLGQFDAQEKELPFSLSDVSSGQDISPESERRHVIEVNGGLLQGQLRLSFIYNKHEYDKDRILLLTDCFKSNLIKIIAHCQERQEKESTPSDLGCPQISLEALAAINENISLTFGKEAEIRYIYPLSPMQNGMFYLALRSEIKEAYFEQFGLSIEGEVNEERLQESLNKLIERHDILRTNFLYEKLAEPLQVVLKNRVDQIHFEDISHLSKGDKVLYIDKFKEMERKRGFDLTRDKLMKLSLLKKGWKSYEMVWSFHHILMDGWCLGLIFGELLKIYEMLKEKRTIELEPLTTYFTYIKWLGKQDKRRGLQYWQEYLKGYEERAGFPGFDRSRKGVEYQVEEYSMIIDDARIIRLQEIASSNQVTMNTLFQTLWGILLAKYNNRRDVVFGTVVSGRPPDIKGIENMIGLFINTIPVRVTFQPELRFSHLLKMIHDEAAASKRYEYLQLAEIQSLSPLKGNLMDHIMAFENYPLQKRLQSAGSEKAPDFRVIDVSFHEQTNYDFNITVAPAKPFTIRFNYNVFIYNSELIKRVGSHFGQIVKQVLPNEDLVVDDIEIITAEEKRQVMYDFNSAAAAFPEDKTIHQLVEEQVSRTPEHIAIIGKERQSQGLAAQDGDPCQITYREMNGMADRLAVALRAKGVKASSIVGIRLDRSIELIVYMLSILKNGGAYLPIDPFYPRKRIDFMLADSGAHLVINDELHDEGVMTGEIESGPDRLPLAGNQESSASDIAYVIYTSGSTGRPKGVLIRHQGFINLLCSHHKIFSESPDDRFSQVASPSFDAMASEVWPCLTSGAGLHIADNEVRSDPKMMKLWLINREITIAFQPTVMAEHLLRESWPQSGVALKALLTAGDKLTIFPAYQYPFTLYNLYGPTEDTVWTSWTEVEVEPDATGFPSIGKPIDNHRVNILSVDGGIQPVGVPGELVISGIGVAVGYVNRPELTGEKFEDQMYRTGDLARWLPDGNIEFMGRLDQQVKIRGFRIELGEIEFHLSRHNLVKDNVVVDIDTVTGEKYLCAYIVPREKFELAKLSDFLIDNLAHYMIPSYFIEIDELPVTPGGKLDRHALPNPEGMIGKTYIAPRNELEEKMVELWSVILGRQKELIGIKDDFFQLGGHSLKVTMLVAKLHETFNVKISINDIFGASTVEEMCSLVSVTDWVKSQKEVVNPEDIEITI